ncbi:H-NS family nucleoid-associated regulatory protein [Niveibacterium umoris]|uniref:DNA-binding protein H-NS n=1 Tax=Niveibacterium umoris TaxID=1193620 RepID=A0A840BPW9_9RHOO|nr:H-NS histone family protein [Niveibacterium umoris]MBB4012886.1 DNA-binding protein H-NS [Niveibacterium umoris]
MELTKQSLTELKRLLKRVEAEIERRANSAKKDVLKKVNKLVSEAGLSLGDLIGDDKKPARKAAKPRTGAAKPGRKAAVRKTVGTPKYRNPANTAQTWTGHGRKPGWVAEWLASGKALAELEIR